jgi:HK97 gp10 family phage protein
MTSQSVLTFKVDTEIMKQIRQNTPQNLERFLDGEAESIVTDVKLSFGTSPSSPGEPPGVDTGNLRNNIDWNQHGALVRWINANTEYAEYLEHGTEHIIERPFMGPAFMRAEQSFASHARQARLIA